MRNAVLGFLLLCSTFLWAQDDIIHFDNIGREDGLSQSTVSGIVQGDDGFMWFATAEGLHRYDGYKLKVYKHDIRDSNSLSDNHLTALFEDSKGYLWVGTYSGNIDRFNKKTKTFEHLRFKDTEGNPNRYQINCIQQDKSGRILVGTDGGGLAVLDVDQESWLIYNDTNSLIPNNYIKCINKEANGLGLWVGSLEGIVLYNNGVFKTFSSLQPFSNQAVNDILHFGTKLYVATDGQGLQIWDIKRDEVVAIPSPRIRYANFTTFVNMDSSGSLWIGTRGAGLMKFTGDEFVTYRHNPFNYRSLIGDKVNVSYTSAQGILWFGCQVGISKYDPNQRLFHLFRDFVHEGKPVNNNMYSMYETKDGMIWSGTLGGGLSRFNPKTEEIIIYPVIQDGDVESRAVRAIYEDKEGVLWVGTRDEGLFSFDRSTEKFTHYPPQRKEIKTQTVMHIMEDSDGMLWIATRWGIARFDRETKRYTMYQTGYLNNNPIYQIYEDTARNEFLLVTFRTGLHIFNRDNLNAELVLQHDPEDSTSPSTNSMMCIEPIGNDSFIVGTYGGGLNIFDRKAGIFTSITSQNGLPNDVVYGILRGENNDFWLSTNDGIIKWDMGSNSFTTFNLSHYLQSLEYNEGAYCKSRDNTLYFGGQKGFNYFKPDVILNKIATPQIAFTDFKKANKSVGFKRDINYLKEILVSHNENLISIEFAALNFVSHDDNLYAYQLEGFDDEWIDAENRQEAFYTNLSPGTYTFKVRASSKLGNWEETQRSIVIRVLPPYWSTWWFRSLVVLGILGIILLIFRQRTKSIALSYQHKMVDLELKALRSQMNPHFIFNSLNSIQYFVLKNEPKEAYTYLTKFSSLMRMILQNARVKYISLHEEYEWLSTYLELEKLRMEQQLDFSITIDESLDPKRTFVPSMLVQPYVENAIVHGLLPKQNNRVLTIRFTRKNKNLQCVIEDNGIGRDKSAELNAQRTKKHKSQGIRVTSERLKVLTQDRDESPEFFIKDLFDEKGEASGTRVTLTLPIVTEKDHVED